MVLSKKLLVRLVTQTTSQPFFLETTVIPWLVTGGLMNAPQDIKKTCMQGSKGKEINNLHSFLWDILQWNRQLLQCGCVAGRGVMATDLLHREVPPGSPPIAFASSAPMPTQ